MLDKFTLLTPESLWYPTTFPPVNPEAPYNIRKNFADFSLKVYNPNERTILSQGTPSQSGDTTIFKNNDALLGISLAIGDYEKKSVTVDSVEIELYNFKGHDYFSKDFPHMADTLVGFLTDIKSEYEMRKGRKYPFPKLVLAETPFLMPDTFATGKATASKCNRRSSFCRNLPPHYRAVTSKPP